jgi:hypothetical protein
MPAYVIYLREEDVSPSEVDELRKLASAAHAGLPRPSLSSC